MPNNNSDENTSAQDQKIPNAPQGSTEKIRNILACSTVLGFLIITASIAILFPIQGLIGPDEVVKYLRDVASIYSGIVGLIVGYYFGKP